VGGGAVPLSVGGARSPSNTTLLGRGLPQYQMASWYIQSFGHNTPTLETDRTMVPQRRVNRYLWWLPKLVSWSLTSLFSTNMAISETKWLPKNYWLLRECSFWDGVWIRELYTHQSWRACDCCSGRRSWRARREKSSAELADDKSVVKY